MILSLLHSNGFQPQCAAPTAAAATTPTTAAPTAAAAAGETGARMTSGRAAATRSWQSVQFGVVGVFATVKPTLSYCLWQAVLYEIYETMLNWAMNFIIVSQKFLYFNPRLSFLSLLLP